MIKRSAIAAALGLIVLAGNAGAATTQGAKAAATTTPGASAATAAAHVPSLVTTTCSACHGPAGVSFVPTFPNLAGQGAPYLIKQINDFRNHTRADPQAKSIMWAMAAAIPANKITEIADYFASQKGAPGAPENPQLVAAGRAIYLGGVTAKALPACAACHGSSGLGVEPLFPRLAGQHQAYVVSQLQYFKAKQRTNDPLQIMQTVAGKLSAKEMQEVAAFIRTL
ncbi:MAG: c-type cytochrome [Gammaproteobacteria bacterium]|nr:c-type cytochrome [Gammaproteobacteria bacterium]